MNVERGALQEKKRTSKMKFFCYLFFYCFEDVNFQFWTFKMHNVFSFFLFPVVNRNYEQQEARNMSDITNHTNPVFKCSCRWYSCALYHQTLVFLPLHVEN